MGVQDVKHLDVEPSGCQSLFSLGESGVRATGAPDDTVLLEGGDRLDFHLSTQRQGGNLIRCAGGEVP